MFDPKQDAKPMEGWKLAPNTLRAFQAVLGPTVIKAWVKGDPWIQDDATLRHDQNGQAVCAWDDMTVRLRLADGRLIKLMSSEWARCVLIEEPDDA